MIVIIVIVSLIPEPPPLLGHRLVIGENGDEIGPLRFKISFYIQTDVAKDFAL